MDEAELLWKLYEDNRAFAKHHETQRSTAANITMIISAGIIGLLTFDQKLESSDLALSVFLTLLGLFGAAFSAKLYERVRLHLYRAEKYLSRLEELLPDARTAMLRDEANEVTRQRFPRLYGLRLFWFWVILPLFIASVGFATTLLILSQLVLRI